MREILRKFDINSLYTCPPHLYTVTTLPWEIQKVFFQQYYSYRLHIIMLSQKKQTATVVLQLICLLTVVFCFLLRSSILWSVFYLFGQSFSKPPMHHVIMIMIGWLRSTVGRTPVFGRQTDPVLSSACSRRVTTMWVNRPLQVSQLGQLSLSSFWGQ